MKQARSALLMLLVMTIITGIAYPLMMTGLGRLVFPGKSQGSLIRARGRTVGSELIAQGFTGPGYFHGRPSAINYDGTGSGGSNFGPTNKKLVDAAAARAEQVRKENGLAPGTNVPADLVLASGSGLDPHVSLASALLQIPRIARTRSIGEAEIHALVSRRVEKRYFGTYGDAMVNVLTLNIELNAMDKRK
jgi:potassium-transporting ATPase KdpC subunit